MLLSTPVFFVFTILPETAGGSAPEFLGSSYNASIAHTRGYGPLKGCELRLSNPDDALLAYRSSKAPPPNRGSRILCDVGISLVASKVSMCELREPQARVFSLSTSKSPERSACLARGRVSVIFQQALTRLTGLGALPALRW